MACCHWPRRVFCWPMSREFPRRAPWPRKTATRFNPRQELLGLSAANLAAAFCHGFPIAGGLSQSAVNDKAGAVAAGAGLRLAGNRRLSAVLHRPAAQFAVRGAGGDCAGRRAGSVRRCGTQAPVARESIRVQPCDGGTGRRAFAGNSQGRTAGCDRVAAHAAGHRGPTACRLSRTHPRHVAIFRPGAASRQ